MRTLSELINTDNPGIELINKWVKEAENDYNILPPSINREDALYKTQVSTGSTMGAIIYDTGGIIINHGWLRFLGSGHNKLSRILPEWNDGRAEGFLLVADDAVGGFFAINAGVFGEDIKSMYYWAPDNLEWEPLQIGFTDFFRWSLTSKLSDFYQDLRWPSWKEDIKDLHGDSCFAFYPFLWTEQGSVIESHRKIIPVSEVFDLKTDFIRQLKKKE